MNLTDIDWNDPNLQIGAEISAANIQKQICRAQKSQRVASNSGGAFDLVIQGDPEAKSPLTIHSFRDRDCAWILNRQKPDKWCFIASPLISWGENPICWGEKEIVDEMRYWPPPEGTPDEESRRIVRGHYSCLRLWLEFYLMKDVDGLDERHELLYTSDLIHLKPYVDLSKARREFCHQLFPWSKLAQRGGTENHLWFCLEYSACLAKLFPEGNPGKVENRERNSDFIKTLKTALKTRNLAETLTIEDLQEQGEDWRLHLEDLLLQDAIRLVCEDETDSPHLKRYISRYLNALSNFNAITGHRECDIVFRRSRGGEISQSRKGQKLKNQPKPSRGRGRPPKCKDL